jgi:hypothetical protein
LNSLLKNLWKTQFQKLNETGYETIIRSADDQRAKKRKLEDDEETTTKQAVWKLL